MANDSAKEEKKATVFILSKIFDLFKTLYDNFDVIPFNQ